MLVAEAAQVGCSTAAVATVAIATRPRAFGWLAIVVASVAVAQGSSSASC